MRQDFILVSAAERARAELLNDGGTAIMPRAIDHPDAGELLGLFVVPARVMQDGSYARWLEILSGLPRRELDPATIFAPGEE